MFASQPVGWLTACICLELPVFPQVLNSNGCMGVDLLEHGADGCSRELHGRSACCRAFWIHGCHVVMVLVGCHYFDCILDLLHDG